MFTKNGLLTLACLLMLAVAGCHSADRVYGRYDAEEMEKIELAKRDNLPAPTGGLVLSVQGEAISVDEIIEPLQPGFASLTGADFKTFVANSRPAVSQMVVNKVTDILLYKQAKKTAGEQIEDALEKAVENEVDRFIVKWDGDYAKAQAALEEMGMDWASFRDYQKKMLLTQSYVGQQVEDEDAIISRRQMREFYDDNPELFERKGEFAFSLIDIRPDQLTEEQLDGRTKDEAALMLAGTLYARAQSGDDFAELAKEYSHGHMAAMGGKWDTLSPGSLSQTYAPLEQTAKDMDAPGLAGPIVSPGHVFIMKLENYQQAGKISFEDAQDKIEYQIRMHRRQTQFNDMIAKLIEQANIGGMERFVDYCLLEAFNRYGTQG